MERLNVEIEAESWGLLVDARNEIERLRAECDDLQVLLRGRTAEFHAEIERLRAAGDELVASLTPVSFAGPHEAMNRLERAYLAWGEARRG